MSKRLKYNDDASEFFDEIYACVKYVMHGIKSNSTQLFTLQTVRLRAAGVSDVAVECITRYYGKLLFELAQYSCISGVNPSNLTIPCWHLAVDRDPINVKSKLQRFCIGVLLCEFISVISNEYIKLSLHSYNPDGEHLALVTKDAVEFSKWLQEQPDSVVHNMFILVDKA